MLNSAEYEIFPAHKFKMPTIVGILTLMSRKNSILGLSEPEKKLNFLYSNTYDFLKFNAQQSLARIFFYYFGVCSEQSDLGLQCLLVYLFQY